MRTIIFLFLLLMGCELSDSITDLTPDTPHQSEFAFHLPDFYDNYSTEESALDTFYHKIEDPGFIISGDLYLVEYQYWATDTFIFHRKDFSIVMDTLQRITNGFDIRPTSTSGLSYKNFNGRAYYYQSGEFYLFPAFNKSNQIYWIQVIHEKDPYNSWFRYYTVRAIWMTGKRKLPDGDIS